MISIPKSEYALSLIHISLAGRQQAGEHLHGGALAAAVGAEKTEDFAAADAKRHRIDRDEVAEAHAQAPGLDGDLAAVPQRGNHYLLVPAAALFRQQGDKGLLQACLLYTSRCV